MPERTLDDVDALFVQLKARAELLVRQLKDDQFDDAVLRLVSAMLDVRSTTERETLAEVEARLKPLSAVVEKAL